jgi:hypothetical protein
MTFTPPSVASNLRLIEVWASGMKPVWKKLSLS